MTNPDRDELVKLLCQFFLDEFREDAIGVGDWLAQSEQDADIVVPAVKLLLSAGGVNGEPQFAGEIAAKDLTAPGATTKSDGGAKAGSSPVLASKEEQRSDTHGMMPVGDNAAYVGSTGVGPSDLKTPPELLALIERAKNHVMTPEEIHEQRRSFARGMCPSHRDYKERCEQIDKLMPPLRPSDTSSTRSDVTVEELARSITPNPDECVFGSASVGFGPDGKPQSSFECSMRAWERNVPLATALLDQFEIRRRP